MRSHAVYGLMSGTSPYWPSIYSVLRPITDIHDVRIAFFGPVAKDLPTLSMTHKSRRNPVFNLRLYPTFTSVDREKDGRRKMV